VTDVSISRVIGGAERVLFEHTTRLVQKGHSVHILTRKLPWHRSNSEKIKGVWEWRFDFNDHYFLTSVYSTVVRSRRLFERLCEKSSFDIINLHQPFTAVGVLSSPKSKNIKKVYTCHSLSFEEFLSRNPLPPDVFRRFLYAINWRLRRMVEKNILEGSDKIVVLSDFTAETLLHHYSIPNGKIVHISGGVDLEYFRLCRNRTALRKNLNIPAKKLVLFTVRNLVSRMGVENLICAMGEVADKIPELYLVIGGQGPLQEKLKTLARQLSIQDRVRFTGFIEEEDLPFYYQMADLFVLPTKELEGFGLVTLESLACGTPVLGTPIGGTKEILGKLNSDFLFKDASPGAMAASILRMALRLNSNRGLRKSLSQQCRAFVETYYSWDDKIYLLERLFQELLSKYERKKTIA
jgi:glycosyltransferase involved in cell wall biosynthesis